jgi:hypothetical protein
MGRVSNFMGASFSGISTTSSVVDRMAAAAGFTRGGLAAAVFGAAGFGADLVGFTGTFDVAMDVGFCGGRAAFLGAADL